MIYCRINCGGRAIATQSRTTRNSSGSRATTGGFDVVDVVMDGVVGALRSEVEVSVGGEVAETRSRLSRLDSYLFAFQGRNAEPDCTPLSSAISWKRRYLRPEGK